MTSKSSCFSLIPYLYIKAWSVLLFEYTGMLVMQCDTAKIQFIITN